MGANRLVPTEASATRLLPQPQAGANAIDLRLDGFVAVSRACVGKGVGAVALGGGHQGLGDHVVAVLGDLAGGLQCVQPAQGAAVDLVASALVTALAKFCCKVLRICSNTASILTLCSGARVD